MITHKVRSIDVSLGGLRVESASEISPDSVVSFIMSPDFSSESLLGFGEVKWCISDEESNKFESGIAFSSYSTSESMREYLQI